MALPVARGRDTYCLDTLSPGRLVSGKALVAQRLYRRLVTPPGMLRGGEDEADFGVDLPGMVGGIEPVALASTLPVRVENELRKDPAVSEITVDATRTSDASGVTWTLRIDVETTEGDVELIMAVSDVSVELLGVR